MFHRHAELHLHLVWTTWDRAGWIHPSIRGQLHGVIVSVAQRLQCRWVVVGGTDDHVHVLTNPPPTLAPATLVGRLKGASSHFAHERLGVLPAARWSEGYAAFSVSTRDVDTLSAYVSNQELHHTGGTLIQGAELGDDDAPASFSGNGSTSRVVHPPSSAARTRRSSS